MMPPVLDFGVRHHSYLKYQGIFGETYFKFLKIQMNIYVAKLLWEILLLMQVY